MLVIGHMATWYALEGAANGTRLDDLFYAPFEWQEDWEYSLARKSTVEASGDIPEHWRRRVV